MDLSTHSETRDQLTLASDRRSASGVGSSLALLLLLILSMTQFACEEPDGVELFSAMGPVTQLPDAADVRGVRRATVSLHPMVGEAGAFVPGDLLQVELLDGQVYAARVDKFELGAAGAWTLRARFVDDTSGYLLFSTTAGETLGKIRSSLMDLRYEVRKQNDAAGYYLIDLGEDDSSLEGSGPLIPPPPESDSASTP